MITAMKAMTLIAVALLFSAIDNEEKAIKAIVKLGGRIERDDGNSPGKPVVYVNLIGARVTDESLKPLIAFKHLKEVSLDYTKVTNIGLKSLAAHSNLKSLYLRGTQMTVMEVEALIDLQGLHTLHLFNSQIKDDGLKKLAILTKLESLEITNSHVTDAGLVHLSPLRREQFAGFTCDCLGRSYLRGA